MGDMDRGWLKEKILEIERRLKTNYEREKVDASLRELVEFSGWQPGSYQGRLLSYVIHDGIRAFKGNLRKDGDPYYSHNIMTLKEVSKIAGGKSTDVTLAVGALKHDDIEEAKDYSRFKRKFVGSQDDEHRSRAEREINRIKGRCVTNTSAFFTMISPEVISVSGFDIDSAIILMESLTRRPDENYITYLKRIFGKAQDNIPEYLPLLNMLRSGIIKEADRLHNNSTVPSPLFTSPQRSKECFKSFLAIDSVVNFLKDYPESVSQYPQYSEFLDDSRYGLNTVVYSVLEENLSLTSDDIIKHLDEERGKDILAKVSDLFSSYGNYRIMPLPSLDDVRQDQRKIYDGTLSRLMGWIVKDYRGGTPRPENIGLTEVHKRWMSEELGIYDGNVRKLVLQYMDDLVLKGVSERFRTNRYYSLEGLGDI